jgi:hypothetical protein
VQKKHILAVAVGLLAVTTLLADERKFAAALAGWQRRPSVAAAFHVLTSGLFLAGDVATLG